MTDPRGRATAPIRTLVVDDDHAAARLHATCVAEQEGFTVVATVGTGEAALHAVRNGAADLLLLDIDLPGFSGIEVLHQIRTASRRPVDVIVVTAARDRVTVRQAVSSHVVAYLVKPFGREALVQRLRRYRHSRSASFLTDTDSFGQGEIDALLAPARPAGRAGTRSAPGARPRLEDPLPKGLSRTTLAEIVATLDRHHPRTTREVAESSGTSLATVRRYLVHLHRAGIVDVSHRYGRRGRPELLYRLAPPT